MPVQVDGKHMGLPSSPSTEGSDAAPQLSRSSAAKAKLRHILNSQPSVHSAAPPSTHRATKRKSLSTLLLLTTDRLSHEHVRVSELENRVESLLTILHKLTQSRDKALAQVSRLTEELGLYKIQLDRAQQEVFKAEDVIRRLEDERKEADEDAQRQRDKVRKLLEDRSLEKAKEDGYREGWERARLEIGIVQERIRETSEQDDEEDAPSPPPLPVPQRGRNRAYTTSAIAPAQSYADRPNPEVPARPASTAPSLPTQPQTRGSNSNVPMTSRPPPFPAPAPAPTSSQTPAPRAPPARSSESVPSSIHPIRPPSRPPTRASGGSRPQPTPVQPFSRPPTQLPPSRSHNAPPPTRPTMQHNVSSPAHLPFHLPPDNYIPKSTNDRIDLPPPHELSKPISVRDLRKDLGRAPSAAPPNAVETSVAPPLAPITVSDGHGGPPIVQIPMTPQPSRPSSFRGKSRESVFLPPYQSSTDLPLSSRPQSQARSFRIRGPGTNRTRSRANSIGGSTHISEYGIVGPPDPKRRPRAREEEGEREDSLERVEEWIHTGSIGRNAGRTLMAGGASSESDHHQPQQANMNTHDNNAGIYRQQPPNPNVYPSATQNLNQDSRPSRPGSPINWLRNRFKAKGRAYSSGNTVPQIAIEPPSQPPSDGTLTGVMGAQTYLDPILLTPEPQELTSAAIEEYIENKLSPRLRAEKALPPADHAQNSTNPNPAIPIVSELPPGFIPSPKPAHANPAASPPPPILNTLGPAPVSASTGGPVVPPPPVVMSSPRAAPSSRTAFSPPPILPPMSITTPSKKIKKIVPATTYAEAPIPPGVVYPDPPFRGHSSSSASASGHGPSSAPGPGLHGGGRVPSDRGWPGRGRKSSMFETTAKREEGEDRPRGWYRSRAVSFGSETTVRSAPLGRPISMFDEDDEDD